MLSTSWGFQCLYEHCEREYSTENIVCWKKIQEFMSFPRPSSAAFEVRREGGGRGKVEIGAVVVARGVIVVLVLVVVGGLVVVWYSYWW